MSSRKQRERLREARLEFDRIVAENRIPVVVPKPKKEEKEEPKEEKAPKKRGRPTKKRTEE